MEHTDLKKIRGFLYMSDHDFSAFTMNHMTIILKNPNILLNQLELLLGQTLFNEYKTEWFKIIRRQTSRENYKDCFKIPPIDGCTASNSTAHDGIITEVADITGFLSLLHLTLNSYKPKETYKDTRKENDENCAKLYFYKCVLYPIMYIILKHVLELVLFYVTNHMKFNKKYNASLHVLLNLFIKIPAPAGRKYTETYIKSIDDYLFKFYGIKYTMEMLYTTLDRIRYWIPIRS
jgi:hypothetical protein